MINLIFSLDYEIYGNGEGDIRELIFLPTERLISIFDKYGAKLSIFVETAELQAIKEVFPDKVAGVEEQLKKAFDSGHDVQLHLHPQWINSKYEEGRWHLDFSEYNLARLGKEKIRYYLSEGKTYLESIINDKKYHCHTFRAGNWLLQPSKEIIEVLIEMGFRYDSSVFKGGYDPQLGLDYRKAASSIHSWKIRAENVNECDRIGKLIEIPIFTKYVFITSMFTGKRKKIQKRSASHQKEHLAKGFFFIINSIIQKFRIFYPKKFDFCRMTLQEMTKFLDQIIKKYDHSEKNIPVVLIGHSKDFEDDGAIENFFKYCTENYNNSVKFETYSTLDKTIKSWSGNFGHPDK